MLLMGVFAIFCGRASEKYGPKRVMIAMGVITGLSLVLTSRVQTPSQVWFSYSFCLFMVLSHLVPQAQDAGFPPLKAAVLLSLLTAAVIPGRIIGGVMADRLDRRKITAVLSLMLAAVGSMMLDNRKRSRRKQTEN